MNGVIHIVLLSILLLLSINEDDHVQYPFKYSHIEKINPDSLGTSEIVILELYIFCYQYPKVFFHSLNTIPPRLL